MSCPSNCETCTNSSVCQSCLDDLPTYFDKCSCVVGLYRSQTNGSCQKCSVGCSNCSSLDICHQCQAGFTLTSGACISNCLQKYYWNNVTNSCSSCGSNCATCLKKSNCTSCDPSQYRELTANGKCTCMQGYYDIGTCQLCPSKLFCVTCAVLQSHVVCLTCDATANRVLSSTGSCICKAGYTQPSLKSAGCVQA